MSWLPTSPPEQMAARRTSEAASWTGPGTLTRRGDKWQARIYLGPDFKPSQPSRTFTQRGDAEAWLYQMAARKARGQISVEQPGEMLIGELFQDWKEKGWPDRVVGLADKTQALYADWWNRYCVVDREFVLMSVSRAGSREINAFRRRVQGRLQASYEAETAERARRGKGPRKGRDPEGWPTVNKVMVMISAMFTHGRREGLLRLASDPTVERAHPMRDGAVPRLAVETLPVDPLGFYEIELIRAAMLLAPRRRGTEQLRGLMSVAALSTMAWAGARPSEAFTPTQGGIYREAGKLWLIESKRRRARHTSRQKGRNALLLAPLLDDLDTVIEARPNLSDDEMLLWLRTGFDEDDLRNWRTRWFAPAAAAVGIDATPKSLRHSFASVSAAAGINDVLTAAEMGHSITVHRDKYVKPLTRYASAPFVGPHGAEQMIYEARHRALGRVSAWLEQHGSLAGLAGDLREEIERDRDGRHGLPI